MAQTIGSPIGLLLGLTYASGEGETTPPETSGSGTVWTRKPKRSKSWARKEKV